MSNEKKLVLFIAFVFVWMFAHTYISRFMGWNPPPKRPPLVAVGKEHPPKPDAVADEGLGKDAALPAVAKEKPVEKVEAQHAGPKPSTEAEIERVNWSELVLGSTTDRSPGGYRLSVQLEQKGAGIDSVHSARFDAEFEYGKPRKRPLEFISRDTKALPSMALNLSQGPQDGKGIRP